MMIRTKQSSKLDCFVLDGDDGQRVEEQTPKWRLVISSCDLLCNQPSGDFPNEPNAFCDVFL